VQNTTSYIPAAFTVAYFNITVANVTAGKDAASFAVSSVPVTSPSDVNITASLGLTTVTSSTVTLNP
jgi:hypothetical protein